jgi:hypothetical protein
MSVKVPVFWGVVPCSLKKCTALMMETVSMFETSISLYQIRWHSIPQDSLLHSYISFVSVTGNIATYITNCGKIRVFSGQNINAWMREQYVNTVISQIKMSCTSWVIFISFINHDIMITKCVMYSRKYCNRCSLFTYIHAYTHACICAQTYSHARVCSHIYYIPWIHKLVRWPQDMK